MGTVTDRVQGQGRYYRREDAVAAADALKSGDGIDRFVIATASSGGRGLTYRVQKRAGRHPGTVAYRTARSDPPEGEGTR